MDDHEKANSSDDWEYEYDDVETETFFVDIDLSSVNPQIKTPALATPTSVIPAKRNANGSPSDSADADTINADTLGDHEEETNMPDSAQVLQETSPPPAEDDQTAPRPTSSRVQILELDSNNPIVSYQGQIYSCTWSDMIGTNMFFARPEKAKGAQVKRQKKEFNLVGMSRVKLVGQKAKVTKKPTGGVKGDADKSDVQTTDTRESSHQSLGNPLREKHVSFLERIKEINRKRAETEAEVEALNTEPVHEQAFDEQESHDHPLNIKAQPLPEQPSMDDASAFSERLQKVYSRPDETQPQPIEPAESLPDASSEIDANM